MPKTPRNWPASALPRRMDRAMAAYYCGLSPGSFDAAVADGEFPKPRQQGRRLVWDIHELDRAMNALDGLPPQGADSRAEIIASAEAKALAAIGRG